MLEWRSCDRSLGGLGRTKGPRHVWRLDHGQGRRHDEVVVSPTDSLTSYCVLYCTVLYCTYGSARWKPYPRRAACPRVMPAGDQERCGAAEEESRHSTVPDQDAVLYESKCRAGLTISSHLAIDGRPDGVWREWNVKSESRTPTETEASRGSLRMPPLLTKLW